MAIEPFTRRLLLIRNNLVEMIKAAKGEQVNEQENEQLKAAVKHLSKELEAAKEKIRGLVTSREMFQQLLKNTNDAYRVFSTGGSLEEMRKVFEHVDDLMADMNIETKAKSSSSDDDDDEDDGGGGVEEDPGGGGAWDHSAELRWPTSSNIGPEIIHAQYPSSGSQNVTSHYAEDNQRQSDAGNRSPMKKTVTFALHPPSLQNLDGQSVSHSVNQSSTAGQSVYDVQNPIQYASNTPGVRVPTRSSILSTPPPVAPLRPRVPGYKDYPGVVLLHERGGTVCGGTPNGDKVIKGSKLIKTVFVAEDEPLQYLEKRRRFCDEISSFMSGEDIYTILGIFRQSAACYYKTLTKLFKNEGTYTSFLNFLRTFEHTLFPSMDAVATGALHSRVQGDKESVTDYYTDYSDLIYIIGRNEDDYINQWLAGLHSRPIAHVVANKIYDQGQRTLENIANHASHVETEMGLEKIFRPSDTQKKAAKGKGTNDNNDSNDKNVSAITASTGLHSNGGNQRGNNATQRGRSRGAQRGGQQQQRGASWNGSYSNSSNSLGNGGGNWARFTPSSRGGHNQSRGGQQRSQSAGQSWGRGGSAGGANSTSSWRGNRQSSNTTPKSASVAAVNAGQSEMSDPIYEMYRRKMRDKGLYGCGACLALSHEYRQSDNYRYCRRLCPCCGTNLRSQDHFAIDCHKMPEDKWEAIQMTKEADLNGDRAGDAE